MYLARQVSGVSKCAVLHLLLTLTLTLTLALTLTLTLTLVGASQTWRGREAG